MVSVKCVNEGCVESDCVCWALYKKFSSQLGDLYHYQELVAKGLENLTLEEHIFVLYFDLEHFESMHRRMKCFMFPYNVCGCGRKYEVASFQEIFDFSRRLNGIDYVKL